VALFLVDNVTVECGISFSKPVNHAQFPSMKGQEPGDWIFKVPISLQSDPREDRRGGRWSWELDAGGCSRRG
jgi:hypothetical protein